MHLQDCNRKRECLLEDLPDPSFVNLMQDKITSDDSIIPRHYQHRNVWPGAGGCAASVTGWYGLHFAKRPCTPLIFSACQSNTVMTASMTSFPNKTQISLWWLRSLTLLHTSHPLMILTNPVRGGVEVGAGAGAELPYWSSVLLRVLLLLSLLFFICKYIFTDWLISSTCSGCNRIQLQSKCSSEAMWPVVGFNLCVSSEV